ncbi:MAG: hypothetical protein AAF735_06915 [Myxococcota bacterium]
MISSIPTISVSCSVLLALCGCTGGTDRVCDEETTRDDGEDCVTVFFCGEGTALENEQCVPVGAIECEGDSMPNPDGTACIIAETACSPPTQLDSATGRCVAPSQTRCGNGTEQRGSICVPSCESLFEAQNSSFTGCEPAARVQIVHASADPALAVVDVYSGPRFVQDPDGSPIGDDFAFQSATPVIKIGLDSMLPVRVARADSVNNASPLFSLEPGELEAGRRYLVVIRGVVDPSGFAGDDEILLEVEPFGGLLEEPSFADDAQFSFVNASTDSPSVDLVVADSSPEVMLSNVGYEFGGPLQYTNEAGGGPPVFPLGVNPLALLETGDVGGTQLLSVQTTSEDALPGPTGVTGGTAGVIVATGFVVPGSNRGGETADGAALQLLMVLPDGTAAVLDSTSDE